MNKKSAALKLKLFFLSILVLAVFIIVYAYTLVYSKNTFYPTANNGRLLTNTIKLSMEEALADNSFTLIKSQYPYTVIDLKGRVLASTIARYKIAMSVDLNDFLNYDAKASNENPGLIKYSVPLSVNNAQAGSAVFLIPKVKLLPGSPGLSAALHLAPVTLALLISVILTFYTCLLLNRGIFLPLAKLHESTRKILKGDYTCRIQYDYDTEMGTFCHDFEAMRDELKYAKETETAIKANEKELLACLSHDIKTPLTAINGYVSGIKDGIVQDKAGIDNYCSNILNRVKMLTKLLEDILEHSKAELNKMGITLTEFYCGDFFRDIIEDLSIEIESKGFTFKAPEKIPNLLINGDRKRLTQVMYNLVSNSIKYSKENPSISIYFEEDTNYLYVFVKDNGIGISSADIPNIFNKFYRGEKSRNQNIPGSGLGLSISKYIIEAHGGFIHCVESSSAGTVFCFALPI